MSFVYLRYDIIWQCTDRPPKDIIAAKAGIGAFPAAARQPFVTSRMNSKKRAAPGGIGKVDKPSHTVLKITTQAHIFITSFVASPTERTKAPTGSQSVYGISLLPFSSAALSYRAIEKIPVKNDAETVDMYNSTPALTLPSISEPTVPITKAGPAFMQKRQALCASFSVIAFFLSNSYVIFAPMGNPPICDIIITGAKTPGSLNSFSHTLSNGFPAASPRPERRRNEATVIYNPLPFYPEQTSDCTAKEVIAVGRYAYQKGFDLLIETWRIVAQKHPDWNLRIYGGGDRSDFLALKDKYHLDTLYLEEQTPDIIRNYCRSSIFVLSSRYEGFGMVITEAMSCGVPPVSFTCPCGPRDIIDDGKNGLLVENGNIEMLAEKICYLIENDEIRRKMGQQARIDVERFKIEQIAEQWKQLFESLTLKN